MRKPRFMLAAAAAIAVAGAAEACQGSKVLYEDHFAALDPSWGSICDELKVAGGRMVIRPAEAMVYWQTNDLARYADVDVCVSIVITESVAADEVLGGLLFWYEDDDNFHAVEIDSAGHAALWQRTGGEWRATIPWGETDLLAPGDGKVNRVRVLTKGKAATIFINDQPLAGVTAEAALPDGQLVGVIAGSAAAAASTVGFDDFIATAPN